MKKPRFFNRTTLLVVIVVVTVAAGLTYLTLRPSPPATVGTCEARSRISQVELNGIWTPPAPSDPAITMTELTYWRDDIEFLKKQGAEDLMRFNVEVELDKMPNQTVGIVGIDSDEDVMNDSSDFVALPCPPYCREENLCQLVTFEQALSIVQE